MPIFNPSPYGGPKEIHYLFVDGAALHGRIEAITKKFLGGKHFEIDFDKLRSHVGANKVFYYDAIPVRDDGEDEQVYFKRTDAQRRRHDRANKANGVHVYEGDARKRRRRGYEQKKVDVMIAVDMMNHTFRRNMHRATLLTGDGDFKPLVDALVREGMELTLWYPTENTSQELLEAADTRRPLTLSSIKQLLDEESAKGFVIPFPVQSSPAAPRGGKRIRTWGVNHEQELWREGPTFVVTRNLDANNRYDVQHSDPELIKAVCDEHPHLFSLPPNLFSA
jgi:uncharacterized LabA/DUF88 family protein